MAGSHSELITNLVTEIAKVSPLLTVLPLTGFKAECEDCSELTQLHQVIHSGWPKVKKSLRYIPYFLVCHELAVESPLVFHGTRLVVPKSLRERTIHLVHEGHQGLVRTQRAVLVATHGRSSPHRSVFMHNLSSM